MKVLHGDLSSFLCLEEHFSDSWTGVLLCKLWKVGMYVQDYWFVI